MPDNDLTVPELRVLVAVGEAGGFTAAAARLGLTQPAVSHAVRTCERKLGAVLFDRGRHGARATPAGSRATAQARRILRLLETMAAETRGADSGELSGPLRIAAFRSAAAQLLPGALARLTARHPRLAPEVRIVREVDRGAAGEVADGRADLAIATLDGTGALPPGLLSAHLLTEPYSLVHLSGHPAPRTLPLVDWAENCGSYTRDWWAEQDWIPPATVNAEDDSVVLSMVAQGMGMAIMPALALAAAPATVAVTDLGPRRPTRSVGYVTTPEMARSAAVRELIRELRETCGARTPAATGGSRRQPVEGSVELLGRIV